MKQLELLEMELKLIQENIERVKQYEEENEYRVYKCNVFGELKHRLTSLKQRITVFNKCTTSDLFEK